MYKTILAAVTILSFSQVAQAADKSEIWQCMDAATKSVKESCLVNTIEQHTSVANKDFFDLLAKQSFTTKTDAMASVTFFPEQQWIQVKSIEPAKDVLIAANK